MKEICSPTTGMATSFEFLPGLFRFKHYCEQRAGEALDHDRRVREAVRPKRTEPAPRPSKGDYEGPIEDIRPGDIIPWSRMDEYREFMLTKKGVRDTRLWGLNEEWKDNGARPFQISAKPEPVVKSNLDNQEAPTPNPFEQ